MKGLNIRRRPTHPPATLDLLPWPPLKKEGTIVTRPLVFVDCETTGLDPTVHHAYEVAWAIDDGDIHTCALPHTLDHADPYSLKVGGYWDRGFQPTGYQHSYMHQLRRDLVDATMVAANPAFDAAFLRKALGVAPWHYRLWDVEAWAAGVLKLQEVPGLKDITGLLRGLGHTIPEPDHTAAGDVATLRAAFHALRSHPPTKGQSL